MLFFKKVCPFPFFSLLSGQQIIEKGRRLAEIKKIIILNSDLKSQMKLIDCCSKTAKNLSSFPFLSL